MGDSTQILLYALVAGLSPLAFLSSMAVLGSRRGRLNGAAFGTGFLLAQTTVLLIAFFAGAGVTPDRDRDHQTFTAVLGILLGSALLAYAWRRRRSSSPAERSDESRTNALLAKLRHLRASTAFSFGALLGVGGVKRLTLTLFAGTTIALAGRDRAEEIELGLAYVLIATVLVWVPVSIYLVAGHRADPLAARAQSWLTTNQQRATIISTLVFGLLLIGHSILLLA